MQLGRIPIRRLSLRSFFDVRGMTSEDVLQMLGGTSSRMEAGTDTQQE